MLGIACFLEQGPRGWLLAAGLAVLTGGLVVWMRRRDFRAIRSEYDARPLDD